MNRSRFLERRPKPNSRMDDEPTSLQGLERLNLDARFVWILALGLIGLGVAARWLPHPPNFTPVAAIALFAGYVMPNRWTAALTIVGLMLVGDLRIGGYDWPIMATVYLALLAPLVFRGSLRANPTGWKVAGAALASSITFFLATNLAVWATWYEPTFVGLTDCFVAALPFFKWTVQGDLLWSCGLFGLHAILVRARHLGVTPALQ